MRDGAPDHWTDAGRAHRCNRTQQNAPPAIVAVSECALAPGANAAWLHIDVHPDVRECNLGGGRCSTMVARGALFLVILLASCARRRGAPAPSASLHDAGSEAQIPSARPAPAPVAEKLWDGESSLPEELRDAPPFGNDPKRAACGKRPACTVMREKPAGKDAAGRSLSVVVVRLAEIDGMSPREYWTLVRREGAIVARARIASEFAGASYSAEKTIGIGQNELTTWLDWWPTSNWQSYPDRTFQLWPPQLIRFSDRPHHRGGLPVGGQDALDFRAGSGSGSYSCDARKATFVPIPASKLAPGLDPANGLGACAVRVDGTEAHGFMLAGEPDRASAKFLIAKLDALYIEVHDDRWTRGDALEIHVGRPAGFMQCFDPLVPAVMHVVELEAGAVTPKGIEAERISSGPGARVFRITGLPFSGVAVVLRDDDGAGRPVRRVGTAPLHTSPELGEVTHTQAACAKTAEGPALVPYFEQ